LCGPQDIPVHALQLSVETLNTAEFRRAAVAN
jgi:hypothetical protein